MLPVMILGYELFFLIKAGQVRKKLRIILLLTCGAFVIFFLISWLFLGNDPLARVLNGYGSREFTLGQRLLTETRVITHYLSLLILPLPGRLNLIYDFQLSTGIFSPGRTRKLSPGCTCSSGISSSMPSFRTMRAVFGASPSNI